MQYLYFMDKKYTAKLICELIGGSLLQEGQNKSIIYLLIDSRKINSPENSCFFAIEGATRDGHLYLDEAYNKGVRCFVVSKDINISSFPDASIIRVKNSVISLQLLSKKHRDSFAFPIIGITGSNGKTIVKEWLYQILKNKENIVRSPKSYNSQVGVPLSVWQCNGQNTLGIFEAGISFPGEMEILKNIISPQIGIFVNIGKAHDENFVDWDEKTKEKISLFIDCDVLIYCRDYKHIDDYVHQNDRFKNKKLFTWSKQRNANLQIGKIIKELGFTTIQGVYKNSFLKIVIPFIDDASIENAIHCWATLLYLGFDSNFIEQQMLVLIPIAMRLELKEGINNCSLINDYYNSDLRSLEIALDFLEQQNQHKNKTLILSDILESGKSATDLYSEVEKMISEKGITKIIGIGEEISKNNNLFSVEKKFYSTTEDFLSQANVSSFNDETILLKGARPFGFEQISHLFQKRVHKTIMEINLNALENNLNYFKSLLKPTTKIMVMVKAFSYGSGSFEIANLLQFHKVSYLGVAYADEGVELRRAGITVPIMVMNPEPQAFDLMIQHQLEPEIYNFRVLSLFEKSIVRHGFTKENPYPIHIKLDTGMHRLGFIEQDLNTLIVKLKNNKKLLITSVFSHLSTSDEEIYKKYTELQIQKFKTYSDLISEHCDIKPIRHILNSAGIMAFADAQFEMVRLGLGLYGISAFPEYQKRLEQVNELKTTVSQLKTVEIGGAIGYGRGAICEKQTTIATVPIGYADGLRRSLGNKIGFMFIKGQKAYIVGNVCMDMCMLDVSGLDVKEDDEVIVFGSNFPIYEFAKIMQTIPYEALTGISPRVKRVYYQE